MKQINHLNELYNDGILTNDEYDSAIKSYQIEQSWFKNLIIAILQ